jgi:hypothetical protein
MAHREPRASDAGLSIGSRQERDGFAKNATNGRQNAKEKGAVSRPEKQWPRALRGPKSDPIRLIQYV